MSIDILAILIRDISSGLVRLFSRWAKQQSEPDVSQELREQTINIIDDLVNEVAPGYLRPNFLLFRGYQKKIYERVYKSLWDEFGKRRFENVNCRDEIFDFLREVSSEDFFKVIEYLLKEMYRIVHIQKTIPDDIIRDPNAGNALWSRKESVRNRHISRYKGAVDILNYRLSQKNTKYCYELTSTLVKLDAGLDAPEQDGSIQEPKSKSAGSTVSRTNDNQKKDSDIQEPDNNQTPVHHQNHSRSEFWNRRGYRIAVVGVIVAIFVLCFGEGILIRPLHWGWNHLQTILNR